MKRANGAASFLGAWRGRVFFFYVFFVLLLVLLLPLTERTLLCPYLCSIARQPASASAIGIQWDSQTVRQSDSDSAYRAATTQPSGYPAKHRFLLSFAEGQNFVRRFALRSADCRLPTADFVFLIPSSFTDVFPLRTPSLWQLWNAARHFGRLQWMYILGVCREKLNAAADREAASHFATLETLKFDKYAY